MDNINQKPTYLNIYRLNNLFNLQNNVSFCCHGNTNMAVKCCRLLLTNERKKMSYMYFIQAEYAIWRGNTRMHTGSYYQNKIINHDNKKKKKEIGIPPYNHLKKKNFIS